MKQFLHFLFTIILCSTVQNSQAQFMAWQHFTDSIPTLSSPRACDLNNDGIRDLVIGGGTDGYFSNNGIMAINGQNGNLLWKRSSRNEVFGSAIFQDVNNDNVKDVFIVGRSAQLLCINGANGQLIWDFFPYGTNPVDSGLYNFYNPQFISDVTGDNLPDILVSNGGDHAAPAWVTNRPAGLLMVINSATGAKIAQATVPDSAEIYCSPLVIDLKNDGTQWILYGTGGENLGGSFWACPLQHLLQDSLQQSIALLSDPNKGYIAPASVFRKNDGTYDIFVQSFAGRISRIQGSDFSILWTQALPNTESSAAPVIGNFTGSLSPDVMAVVYKGSTLNGYNDYYQMILDGDNGNIVFKDSIGTIHFASGNALDLNNDGRDEGIITITQMDNGVFRHKLFVIDLQQQNLFQIGITQAGVNLGSTPLITDLEGDNRLEIIYVVKKDSVNPSAWKGIYLNRYDLNIPTPNAGIAWGSYMGNAHNGIYNYSPSPCGQGSVLLPANAQNPTCNGSADGSLYLNPVNPSISHTYVWSHGATTSNLTGIPAGTYTVRAVSASGCYEDVSYILNEPFTISYSVVRAVACPGDIDGAAIVGSSGCQCQFSTCTFLWNNGVTTKPNYALSGGWNTVTITHMNGCVVVDSVFIPSTDLTAPSLIVPAGITAYTAPGQCSPVSIALGSPIVSDSCGVLSVIHDAPAVFTTGTTTVTWTATDLNGNTTRATQLVTIIDNESPSISNCPASFSVLANSQNCSATVTWNEPSAADNCQLASIQSNFRTGDLFPLGTTTVRYIATDSSGNADTCQFDITVLNNLQILMDSTLILQAGNDSLIAQVAGGSSPYFFQWSGPQGFSSSLSQPIAPYEGLYYLQITDNNGCMTTDSINAVTVVSINQNMEINYRVFPNPVSEQIYVEQESNSWMELNLIDVLGRVILHRETNLKISSLPTNQLASGTYILQIKDSEGRINLHKLTKK